MQLSNKKFTLASKLDLENMGAPKIGSPPPHPLPHTPSSSILLPPKLRPCQFTHYPNHHQPWRRQAGPPKKAVVRVSPQFQHHLSSSSAAAVVEHLQHYYHHNQGLMFTVAESAGYSLASYYTSLGLFVISVPGLWSLIKRSVKSKIVQKTFIGEGEAKKAPNQVAGEILSFFTRNNFVVTDRGETITFEGMMVPSRGQAALLTFCTCISLASVALVLTITLPDFGNNWFWVTILSPLAGAYYWKRASRKEQIKVKMIVDNDGTLSEIIVQGDDQQVDQMRKELQLSEKGMVYVKGIFER
ncbi:Protein COFACTOR ASSEMBLY OF COMPLEX C SUBUNIT B ccb1, chloroplastic [Turnera subulata]|uniref:Protein COFACTOR ASSEMBLY OF COMPLEX C SUBUNIT B ccb1, chloroplastic n=1 Tax=Turnera subulata TaxID=218843 RepID=A0A9Q0FII6_9ROSI|nr:Protein COFACTOR ASSEMBLY OF COMPLEX C SUBUNIT B ccb1, chloroplastic [Turnera subulata]